MIHENLYSFPTLVFLSVLLIGWYVTYTSRHRAKMAKLGGTPPLVPYHLPFGLDTLWNIIDVRTSS
jgi:hypothetical protein